MSKTFWENRWLTAETGWDLGKPSPPIEAYAQQLSEAKKTSKILIPGCGNGHEALFLLENGFSDVEMLDIAPTAVENMRRRLDAAYPNWEEKLTLTNGDFFEHKGQYDLIFEQTFFCAIQPELRPNYVGQMVSLLKPKGNLVGVLFNRSFEGGPPFGGSAEEYQTLFSPYFHLKTLAPCTNSIAPRLGSEVFIIFEKK